MTIQTLNRSQLAYKYNMSYNYERKGYKCFFLLYNSLSGYKYFELLFIFSFKYKSTILKYDMAKKIK